jgi:hypothetical protein
MENKHKNWLVAGVLTAAVAGGALVATRDSTFVSTMTVDTTIVVDTSFALDSACYRASASDVDSVGRKFLNSTKYASYQVRAEGRLKTKLQAACTAMTLDTTLVLDTTVVVDTTPPDSVPPDSVPPDSVPTDTTPTDTTTPPDTMPVPHSTAELPRALPYQPPGMDSRSCTVHVMANLQAAINAARGGDVLCLLRASSFTGNFILPARTDTDIVVIRTETAYPLPAGRMTPTLAQGTAIIRSPNSLAALKFGSRSAGWYVMGVTIDATSTLTTSAPVALVEIGAGETTEAALPTNIWFDRVFITGSPTQHVRRAFAGNGRAMTLKNSWCEEIHASGYDSQCWISWNAAGPVLIENNYLAAASENLMFGGSDPRVPGLVVADVTIRKNHIHKPISWVGKPWNVKNLVETKSSARVLVEENVLQGSWAQGQVGYAFVLKSTSQNGGCPKCGTSDWTVHRNLIDSVGAGFSIAGRADQNFGNNLGGPTDSTNRRFLIYENWVTPLVRIGPLASDARPVIFTSQNHEMALHRNVVEPSPLIREAILFNTNSAFPIPAWDVTITENVFPRGQYGMGLTSVGEGLKAWLGGAKGASYWGTNVFIGTRPSVAYPDSTFWHGTLQSALGVTGVSRATIDAGVRGVVVPR